mmetsp:Transcript_6658/g.27146  ORF Transcript_6658/g.27146 Transcript_6658/m.27146 type:complete len:219 (+) Transcript_6658:93-749(+)
MIISAASVALSKTCCLTLKDSKMPRCFISPTAPSMTSTPALEPGVACAARSCAMSSAESRPALSAMVVGMPRSARAKASMASAFLPGVRAASSSTALAMQISGAPPPHTTLVSCTVCCSTHSASCMERSASSSTCIEAPRMTMVHASPSLTPPKRISLSSPIMISSISSHSPSLTSSGWSKVEVISPPVTSASRSMPSKSACSIDMMPLSAKISSGKL